MRTQDHVLLITYVFFFSLSRDQKTGHRGKHARSRGHKFRRHKCDPRDCPQIVCPTTPTGGCAVCPTPGQPSNEIQVVLRIIEATQRKYERSLESLSKALEVLKSATRDRCEEAIDIAQIQVQEALDAQDRIKSDLADLYATLESFGSSYEAVLVNYENQISQLQGSLDSVTADNKVCRAALQDAHSGSGSCYTELGQCNAALAQSEQHFRATQTSLKVCNAASAQCYSGVLELKAANVKW